MRTWRCTTTPTLSGSRARSSRCGDESRAGERARSECKALDQLFAAGVGLPVALGQSLEAEPCVEPLRGQHRRLRGEDQPAEAAPLRQLNAAAHQRFARAAAARRPGDSEQSELRLAVPRDLRE